MIFKSQNNLSPSVSIEFNNVAVNYSSIHSVSINLEENKHDVAIVTMNGINPKAITDYIDAAVRIQASIGPGRTVEFCGHVLYVEPESNSYSRIVNESIFQTARIVCFGVSLSMKNTTTRVWENANTVSLVKELAEKYALSAEVFKDSFAIPRLVQSKQSDWEFLTEFCKKYGYSVTVHGTHLRLWDINKALGKQQSFEVLTSPFKLTNLKPGSILKLSGTFGYLTPEGKSYNYSIESIDDSGKLVKTTGDTRDTKLMWSGVTKPTKYNSSLVASSNSVFESEKIIEANFKTMLPFNMRVEVAAALGTIPGGIVAIEGYNSKFEGFWYVRAVEHQIVGSTCTSILKISKDFNTTNSSVVPPSQLGETPPTSKFVSRQWRASIERFSAYV